MLSLCLLLEGDLVIVREGIVVGAFGVIAVNTMMMANLGVMVSAPADTEVSALMCVVLTYVYCLQLVRWYLTGGCLSLGIVWTKMR